MAAYTKAIEHSGPWQHAKTLPGVAYENRRKLNRVAEPAVAPVCASCSPHGCDFNFRTWQRLMEFSSMPARSFGEGAGLTALSAWRIVGKIFP